MSIKKRCSSVFALRNADLLNVEVGVPIAHLTLFNTHHKDKVSSNFWGSSCVVDRFVLDACPSMSRSVKYPALCNRFTNAGESDIKTVLPIDMFHTQCATCFGTHCPQSPTPSICSSLQYESEEVRRCTAVVGHVWMLPM